MILIIDNRDSFVFNIARYFEELGEEVRVVDSHTITVREIDRLKPDALIISPGPCTPDEAGVSMNAIHAFAERLPILGVCLGHQAIGQVFGAEIVRARLPRHGRAVNIEHSGDDLFRNVSNPLEVGLYHSLAVRSVNGTPLISQAWSSDGEIMALRHAELPIFGVQFHPESILTQHGHELLRNFLQHCVRCTA